jgi:hypothetical protein
LVKSPGKHDQMMDYLKPDTRPEWMSAEGYARQPGSLLVREPRFEIQEPVAQLLAGVL